MTKSLSAFLLITMSLTLGVVGSASAYVGPGAGLSLVGAVWGLLAAVVAAIGFIILWPLRRALKRRRQKQPVDALVEENAKVDDRSASDEAPRSV